METENTLHNLIVADILDRWPQTIPLFLKHRMSCVGCMLAPFETLSDALKIYHLPADTFLNELAKMIEPQE